MKKGGNGNKIMECNGDISCLEHVTKMMSRIK